MRTRFHNAVLSTALAAAVSLTPDISLAQTTPEVETVPPQDAQLPAYKPPPRGAPGGRVGGASRGTVRAASTLPTLELLAPGDHAGLTLSAAPTLYYFVSQSVTLPTRFTISAPMRPEPVIEIDIPPPKEAGLHALRLADYRVQLQPGIVYTWSVSVIPNPRARSRDIVASASLQRVVPNPAVENSARAETPSRRVALFAQAGLWYDAVTAAAEAESLDRHAALDALMREVGLADPARYDQRAADGVRSR